jgi:hypothetical protein
MSEAQTAPVTEAPVDTNGVSKEIADIMNFDPFETAQEPASESPPAPVSEPQQPAAVDSPPAPDPTPPVATPDPLQQTLGALQQTVQELPRVMADAVKQQAPAPAEPDAWAPMADGQPLNYVQVMSQIPDAALNGLISENPAERKAAVSNLLGVAMHVAHRLAAKQAVEQVRNEMTRVLPVFVQDQIRTHNTMQGVFTDFYGKYPALSHPSLRGVVQTEAQKLSQQLGVREWTPEFRDRLGEHVMGMLRGVAPATVQAQQPAAPMVGPTARPMAATGSNNLQQEIADLLF